MSGADKDCREAGGERGGRFDDAAAADVEGRIKASERSHLHEVVTSKAEGGLVNSGRKYDINVAANFASLVSRDTHNT
jgi:hypothetical protein